MQVKNIGALILVLALSVTSVRLKIDADGVEIELKKAQQKLAEMQQDNFYLAGDCILAKVD